MAGHMLQGRDHMLLINSWSFPLKSLNSSNTDPGNQIWVLAVCFFNTSPARFPADIHNRRQSLMCAARSYFKRGHREESLNEILVPCACKGNRLRKACAIFGCMAVKTLFMKNHRDTKTCFFDEIFLNRIREFGHLPCSAVLHKIPVIPF